MGYEQVILNAGVLLISLAVGYALWVHVRVIELRDNFFAVRDRLFDTAHDLGLLDDPAYSQCRSRINGAIRSAGTINLVTLGYLIAVQHKCRPLIKSDSTELQDAIDEAWNEITSFFFGYITRKTLAGGLVYLLMRFIPSSLVESKAKSMLSQRDIELTDDAPLVVA